MVASLKPGRSSWCNVSARSWAFSATIWLILGGPIAVQFGHAREAQWAEVVRLQKFRQLLVLPTFATALVAAAFASSVLLRLALGAAHYGH